MRHAGGRKESSPNCRPSPTKALTGGVTGATADREGPARTGVTEPQARQPGQEHEAGSESPWAEAAKDLGNEQPLVAATAATAPTAQAATPTVAADRLIQDSSHQRTQTSPVRENTTQQGPVQQSGAAAQGRPDPMGPCPPGMNERAWQAQRVRLMSNPTPGEQMRRADRSNSKGDRSNSKTGTAAARARRQAAARQARRSTGRGD